MEKPSKQIEEKLVAYLKAKPALAEVVSRADEDALSLAVTCATQIQCIIDWLDEHHECLSNASPTLHAVNHHAGLPAKEC